MPLTDIAIRNTKPKEQAYKLFDGGGLFLLITPSGSRLWRLAYRFAGKTKQLSFGAYPAVSLVDARKKREDAKRELANGEDPSVIKRRTQIEAAAAAGNTFGVVANEYLARLEAKGSAAATLAKNRWFLKKLAGPALGGRPISQITPLEVLSVLQSVERSGRHETARALRAAIGSVFRLAIATLRAEADPTAPLKGALQPPKVVHRPALTDPKAIGALMCSIDAYTGWPAVRAALLFNALTFCRPGEVRGALWKEIDSERATWTIPAERTKMRRPHLVPLSRQALAVLEELQTVTGASELVFPSVRSHVRTLSENAFNSALRRMGYMQDEMTSHGFRAMASSTLNERGFSPDVIEAALAHVDQNAVRRAYNRATYWAERITLMQAWADLLDEFRSLK